MGDWFLHEVVHYLSTPPQYPIHQILLYLLYHRLLLIRFLAHILPQHKMLVAVEFLSVQQLELLLLELLELLLLEL